MSDSKRKIGTINIEPKWISLVPLLLAAIEDGTSKGRAIAIEELKRMAEAADNWNTHCKQSNKD